MAVTCVEMTPMLERRLAYLYRRGRTDRWISRTLRIGTKRVAKWRRANGLPPVPQEIKPPAPGEKACRACGVRRANKPRGLCWGCYYSPEVLKQHPAKVCRLAKEEIVPPTKPASQPCPHLPGSAAKLAELERRALCGERLYHPLDATGDE